MSRNKNITSILVIGAILVGGYYFLFSNKHTDSTNQSVKEEPSKGDVISKQLADKYQAIIGGAEELTYTIQAQERFITDKPVLFTGAYVNDVFNRGGKTFILFSSSWFEHNNYVLELECNKDIVAKVLAQKGGNDFSNFDGEYVVVANIQEITKPVFALKGSALSEDEIEIDIAGSKLFIAKGTCVDVAYVSNDVPTNN